MTQSNRYSRYYTYIQPTFRSKVVKKYGVYTLTIITMAIFIIFAIKPTIETISVLQQKLANSKEVLNKVNQKTQSLQQGRKNYSALGPDILNKINLAIPTEISLKTLVEPLEKVALVNQASISALQIEPIEIKQRDPNSTSYTLDQVDFTFNTEGSYSTLLKILEQLQANPRLILIESVVLNKVADSKTLLMSVSGKAYYLK